MLIGGLSNTLQSQMLKGGKDRHWGLISRFHNQKENLSDEPMNPLLQVNL